MLAQGWQDGLTVCTLASKLSHLGLNPDPAINCHPSISQAGWWINVWGHPSDGRSTEHPICQHSLVDVKNPMVYFAKNVELLLASWSNYKFLPKLLERQWQTTQYNPFQETALAAPRMVHQNQKNIAKYILKFHQQNDNMLLHLNNQLMK